MISTAIQKGSAVYVYNEKNINIFVQPGILQGFTSSSVTIKRGTCIYVYNERGINTMVRSAF